MKDNTKIINMSITSKIMTSNTLYQEGREKLAITTAAAGKMRAAGR